MTTEVNRKCVFVSNSHWANDEQFSKIMLIDWTFRQKVIKAATQVSLGIAQTGNCNSPLFATFVMDYGGYKFVFFIEIYKHDFCI